MNIFKGKVQNSSGAIENVLFKSENTNKYHYSVWYECSNRKGAYALRYLGTIRQILLGYTLVPNQEANHEQNNCTRNSM